MKLVSLFPCGVVAASALFLSFPAQASTLESWKFDEGHNQLEFVTDDDVQPSAQLVPDPTRLVIDLPGIHLGRPVVNESFSGTVRTIRIGQFDKATTRLVIELAPGYTLDPQQIKFRGVSARQWLVMLPTPQPLPDATLSSGTVPSASAASTPGALVVPTQPMLRANASLTAPPAAIAAPRAASNTETATIENIELDEAANQLVIRASRPVRYTARWERSQNSYRIEITAAQLSKQVRGPQLKPGSALRQIRLRQETPQTVVLLLQPAAGVNVGQMNQISQQVLALQLQRTPPPAVATPRQTWPTQANRLPSSVSAASSPSGMTSPPVAPTPNGRIVVIIDPGHGGPDPGAVGVGGLQEKGIVLDIGTKVASLLQQQGIYALLTRADDRDLDLEPRVQMAEQARATAFVSIHANSISLSRPDISGLETYYYQSGEDLAEIIHQSVLQGTGIQDRGVRTARFYVLRKTSMPSVLVEVGFVTGQDDAAKLSNDTYRTQMASAIARGILQYLQRTARR